MSRCCEIKPDRPPPIKENISDLSSPASEQRKDGEIDD
jgi:hypothetical protein